MARMTAPVRFRSGPYVCVVVDQTSLDHDEALVKQERIPAAIKKELFDVAEIGKVTSGKAAFEALKVSNDQKKASGLPAFTDQELPSIQQVRNLMGARNRSIDQKGGSTIGRPPRLRVDPLLGTES
jgi:hypothetical protein